MRLFDFLKKDNSYSQSGQDQFAYNISGSNGLYLEIGAHDPIINSNTFNLKLNADGVGYPLNMIFHLKNHGIIVKRG